MPTRPRARLGAGVATAAVLILALAVPTVLAADRDVAIRDLAFAPRSVEIQVGDTVTWRNRDSLTHTATARNGAFDTGLLSEGRSATVRFTVAGTYRYLCTPHPNMTGTVVVRPATGGVRPPNTDTATVADSDASEGSPSAGLVVLGGLAYLVAQRAFRRRHETT